MPRSRALALFALAVWSPLPVPPARAQFRLDDKPPLPLAAELRQSTIEGVLKEVLDRYIFPDKAEQMAAAIRDRAARKEYDDVKTGQELARMLTEHLQAVSKDKHLRVVCSTEPLPQFPSRGEPSKEDRERMGRMMRWENAGVTRVERLPGNVGYLELRFFPDPETLAEPLAAAFQFLAHTDALILDLRRNGGGSPRGVALVCSYLLGEKRVLLNTMQWREGNRTEEFWSQEKVAGPRFPDRPVYVLTSSRTFSGAEECAYNLQNLKRATLIGETTGGGAHPGGTRRVNDHFAVFVPVGRAVNPISKTNWEGTGVVPEVKAPADDALRLAQEMAVKKLLGEAKDEDRKRMIEEDVERSKRQPAPAAAKK